MKISKVLLLALMGLFTLSSCGDDDEKSNSDILTSGTWMISDIQVDDDQDGNFDSLIEDCDKDDTITLNDDGTWTFDAGATKCDPSDEQTSTGTWSLASNGTTLTTIEDGVVQESEIVEISDSRMVLETEVDFLGIIITSRSIYTR